ncbi:zinc-dependent alcohol dehydrogenase family protein [Rhizosaccharibacter radicis]|uniref:NAD(P)-dependent alcohol dehydrogenase n=1 Tax=Rhizosaccharibacter radicis TaxID=2782605 RepID=A0ABT1VW17_9PROT|nr:NAD(P)-dependent alcohol dehydrogenase [Acetobacteraceae bacterium KSS12]
MKAFEILSGDGIEGLRQVERPERALGPYEVRVRTGAVSLNFRDLMVVRGVYFDPAPHPVIAVSDGAGEVVEVGAAVTRFRVGDRVMTTYFPDWADGPATAAALHDTYGAQLDGVLCERFVAPETGLVRSPEGLDDAEAATLPCAAVTAWNAMFGRGTFGPGHTVLVQGTGGVSVFALQLAEATGVEAIVTSSSDAKLERARALGARAGINYRSTQDWGKAVLRETDGLGVDVVIEVGGAETMRQSLEAVRFGGEVVVIGGLSGFTGANVDPGALIAGNKSLIGVMVGSRAMTEQVARFVGQRRIRPVIDRRFGFGETRAAYEHLQAGKAFGKVVIEVG